MLKLKPVIILFVIQSLLVMPVSHSEAADFKKIFSNPFKKTRSQSPDDEDFEFETKDRTKYIGEYCSFAGLNLIVLQGVGLVTGLDGTGGDPPPSPFRTKLLDEMRRQDIDNPNQILASPDTAMVIVQAYLPALIEKGENFDVEVRVARGDKTTNLNGGWLMPCIMFEYANVEGEGMLKGHKYATASGPILVSVGREDKDSSVAAILRRGKVLAGGTSLKERDMSVLLRYKFQNIRNAKIVSDKIGTRFYGYNKSGARVPLAEAKTDRLIKLKLHKNYKDNYSRYTQVIRSIAYHESDIGHHVRMNKLEEELHQPETSERAAIALEAVGDEAIPVLLSGLKSENLEVQVHSALALAYMNREEGVPILADAARKEPAFRIYSMAGMAAAKGAESYFQLKELLNEESAETRYGAFRALTTMNENEPFVRGLNMDDKFKLHILDTQGPPMVHLTNYKKAEVVLFGLNQKFKSPMVLQAGNHIQVTCQPGSEEVVVSRYQPGKAQMREVVSLNVAEVIKTVTDMGASYPDVAKMLFQASIQESLESRLEIDALPKTGRFYSRTKKGKSGKTKTRIGNERMVPNLYSDGRPSTGSGSSRSSEEEKEEPEESGTSSLTDARADSQSESDEENGKEKGFFKKIQFINYLKKDESE